MKHKSLKKLSKKALIKRLKKVERRNRRLARYAQDLLNMCNRLDAMLINGTAHHLQTITELEGVVAHYFEKFGVLDDDEPSNPKERGRAERVFKDCKDHQLAEPCQLSMGNSTDDSEE